MIPLFFTLLLAQDKAVVEGIVQNALTGEPLNKVHVSLDGGKAKYAAITGADGKFSFKSIEPDEYEPVAERVGFLDAKEEDSFELESGQLKKDLIIKMVPQGVIAGRVVDEEGDPIPQSGIQIERAIQINGRKHLFESSWDVSDAEGHFYFGELKPGHYYITAGQPSRSSRLPLEEREIFAPTEIPLQILLASGAQHRNIEIRLKKTVAFRIRGKVSNPVPTQPSLDLTSAPGRNQYTAQIKNGEFQFEGILPGTYEITVPIMRFQNGALTPAQMFCRVPVSVADHDVEGITIELTPGPNIDGTIKMDGDGKFPKVPSLSLAGFRPNTTEAKEDGSFGWTNLPPTEHNMQYRPPEGFYVKSMQFNHQPVIDHTLDLRSGGGTLEILVAPNAAAVSATVRDAANVLVALWNDAGYLRQENTDAGDSAQFKNLAPGEYRIAAFPKFASDYLDIPEFRARFDAKKITLAGGATQNIEVKLISKSAIDTEIAKLQ